MCPRRKKPAVCDAPARGVIDRALVVRAADLPPRAVAELKREFTRPNQKFYKLQAMGKWTGNIPRMVKGYELEDGLLYFPRGAFGRVTEILDDHGTTVYWSDQTVYHEPSNITFSGKLRPYQEVAVDVLTGPDSHDDMDGVGWPTYPNGVLRGPPGSGKTVILTGAIAARNRPTLVVVHSNALMQQWREECARFLGFAPGTIQGKKVDIKPVTIATQQTLWKRMEGKLPPYVREFELVACDEVHHFASRTFRAVAELFPGAQRLGVSADERRKDGMDFLIAWTFGPVLHEIHAEDLIDIGRLLPIEMTVVSTDYVDEVYLDSVAEDENPDWGGMLTRMTNDMDRNRLIVNRVVRTLKDDPGARILVLTERVEHVDMLDGQLFLQGVKVGKMLGGQKNRKELEQTKRGLKAGRLQVGVGTKVADEGLDIPALTEVFLTCPVHNHEKRIRQMVGRAARPHDGKQVGRATYFWDRQMFPPHPEHDPKRERGERNFLRKLERGVGSAGKVVVE